MQTMTICPRCSGKGSIPQFGHNYEGVCFQCRGLGKIKVARKDAHVLVLLQQALRNQLSEPAGGAGDQDRRGHAA